MENLFVVNSGFAVPLALIVLWLAATAAIRCFVYLSRKARVFFATKIGQISIPLERPLA
ncbi:MAG TPA: hypothetical protein VMT71_04765 [Syntrophorhabdales bacterium]|nr:hypothetical protein [Syntrophorhabdales bacterium]